MGRGRVSKRRDGKEWCWIGLTRRARAATFVNPRPLTPSSCPPPPSCHQVLLIGAGAVMSWQTKNLGSMFAESKPIAFALWNILVIAGVSSLIRKYLKL